MCSVSSEGILCCVHASIYLVATLEGEIIFIDQSLDCCEDRAQRCR